MSTTVLLVDDHPVVRSGLRAWFSEAGIETVGEAEDGAEALSLVTELRPQVVLCELLLPRVDGFRFLTDLRNTVPAPPVLCFTSHSNPTYAARASALGAAGYLPKSAPRDALVDAIGRVARGGACWPQDLVRRLSGSSVNASPPGVSAPLTTREGEVLNQLAFGLSNKEIAQALGISYETVKEHVQHILRKLNVADRTQAAVWAVRQGLA